MPSNSQRQMALEDPSRGATLSPCGVYRYELHRYWSDKPVAIFVMLNPSTADASVDDPTIRRCRGFAQRWGLGGFQVVNLFALRATDPKILRTAHVDPVGRAIAAAGSHGGDDHSEEQERKRALDLLLHRSAEDLLLHRSAEGAQESCADVESITFEIAFRSGYARKAKFIRPEKTLDLLRDDGSLGDLLRGLLKGGD